MGHGVQPGILSTTSDVYIYFSWDAVARTMTHTAYYLVNGNLEVAPDGGGFATSTRTNTTLVGSGGANTNLAQMTITAPSSISMTVRDFWIAPSILTPAQAWAASAWLPPAPGWKASGIDGVLRRRPVGGGPCCQRFGAPC